MFTKAALFTPASGHFLETQDVEYEDERVLEGRHRQNEVDWERPQQETADDERGPIAHTCNQRIRSRSVEVLL